MGICVYRTGVYEIDCPDLAQPMFEEIDRVNSAIGEFVAQFGKLTDYDVSLIILTLIVIACVIACGYFAWHFIRKVKAGEQPYSDIKAAVMLTTGVIAATMMDYLYWDRPLRFAVIGIGWFVFEVFSHAFKGKVKNDRA